MPRPATLPTVDWKAIFESGLDYAAWLAAAEAAEQRDKLAVLLRERPDGGRAA